jgi:hypothetical protein
MFEVDELLKKQEENSQIVEEMIAKHEEYKKK